jgi:hypothetical protein
VRDIAIVITGPRQEQAYALSGANQLLGFDPNFPGFIRSRVAITGLNAGESLTGIDFRPATGRLYGVGSTSQLYVIDVRSGAAAKVGGVFSTLLSGAEFGVDFNPVVDRLRIVSDTGQNLRVNPDTGAIASVDKPLMYNPDTTREPNAGKTAMVVAAAYTNSDTDPATGTILYDIDAGLDILVRQDPPNDGVLNTVGALGVNAGKTAGFDIGLRSLFFTGRGANFQAVGQQGVDRNVAYAALRPNDGQTRLFTVDLGTGRTRERGRIGGDDIRDIAVSLSFLD